jgi:hypothetical protein
VTSSILDLSPDEQMNATTSCFRPGFVLSAVMRENVVCRKLNDRARHRLDRDGGGFVLAPLVWLGSALAGVNRFTPALI